jgi:hypothetical protein
MARSTAVAPVADRALENFRQLFAPYNSKVKEGHKHWAIRPTSDKKEIKEVDVGVGAGAAGQSVCYL